MNIQTKTKKGFTLIELLVVIAIIGILTSIVVSSIGKAKNKARLANAQRFAKQIDGWLEITALDAPNSQGQYRIFDFSSDDPRRASDSYGKSIIANSGCSGASKMLDEDSPVAGHKYCEDVAHNIYHYESNSGTLKQEFFRSVSFWFRSSENPSSGYTGIIHSTGNHILTYHGSQSKFYFRSKECPSLACDPIFFESSKQAIQKNQWHHIFLTFDEAQASLYFDGKLIGSGDSSGIGSTTSALLQLWCCGESWGNIQIANVRLYGNPAFLD